MTRPLTIYSSGGVEKVGRKAAVAEKAVKYIKAPRSEGKIQRNPDGTTTIVYPDSEEEEMVSFGPELGEATVVVNGHHALGYTDSRVIRDRIKANCTEYTTRL